MAVTPHLAGAAAPLVDPDQVYGLWLESHKPNGANRGFIPMRMMVQALRAAGRPPAAGAALAPAGSWCAEMDSGKGLEGDRAAALSPAGQRLVAGDRRPPASGAGQRLSDRPMPL